MDYMYWILTEAERALRSDDPPEIALRIALRYLSKGIEQYRCMFCHAEINKLDPDSYEPYYKGVVHRTCREEYSGRSDYVQKNNVPIEEW